MQSSHVTSSAYLLILLFLLLLLLLLFHLLFLLWPQICYMSLHSLSCVLIQQVCFVSWWISSEKPSTVSVSLSFFMFHLFIPHVQLYSLAKPIWINGVLVVATLQVVGVCSKKSSRKCTSSEGGKRLETNAIGNILALDAVRQLAASGLFKAVVLALHRVSAICSRSFC